MNETDTVLMVVSPKVVTFFFLGGILQFDLNISNDILEISWIKILGILYDANWIRTHTENG